MREQHHKNEEQKREYGINYYRNLSEREKMKKIWNKSLNILPEKVKEMIEMIKARLKTTHKEMVNISC